MWKITTSCERKQTVVEYIKLFFKYYKHWWKITDFYGKLQTVFEDYKMFWKILFDFKDYKFLCNIKNFFFEITIYFGRLHTFVEDYKLLWKTTNFFGRSHTFVEVYKLLWEIMGIVYLVSYFSCGRISGEFLSH